MARSNQLRQKNADEISTFLNAAQPETLAARDAEIRDADALDQTLDEATHQLEGN